jgi:trehalose 6-phosphate synthase
VLILSESAGAAAQLQHDAALVNPCDTEGMADAIVQAFRMDKKERSAHMRRVRRQIRTFNIFWWVDSFLRAAIARDLTDFPLPEDYTPTEDIISTSI